jgi:hypothetical protein
MAVGVEEKTVLRCKVCNNHSTLNRPGAADLNKAPKRLNFSRGRKLQA